MARKANSASPSCPCDSGNAIGFGAGEEAVNVPLPTLIERATQLKEATGLNLLATIPRLQAAGKLVNERLMI